jgi:hypothetical protein
MAEKILTMVRGKNPIRPVDALRGGAGACWACCSPACWDGLW